MSFDQQQALVLTSRMMPLTIEQQLAFVSKTPTELTANDLASMQYSPQIVAIIDQIEQEGNFPYSADVVIRVKATLFSEAGKGLEFLVYNSSRYQQARKSQQAYTLFQQQMVERGYCQATESMLQNLVRAQTKVELCLQVDETVIGVVVKLAQGGYALKPSSTRQKLCSLYIGHYLKLVPKSQHPTKVNQKKEPDLGLF